MSIRIIPCQRTNDPKNLYFTEDEVVNHVRDMVANQPYDGGVPYSHYVEVVLTSCKMLTESHGHKLAAIRLLRTCFPIGLKEAKDYIELNYPKI